MENLVYLLPAFGLIAIVYMMVLSSWVNKQDAGEDKAQCRGALSADRREEGLRQRRASLD